MLEAHPGAYAVAGERGRRGMRVRDEVPEDTPCTSRKMMLIDHLWESPKRGLDCVFWSTQRESALLNFTEASTDHNMYMEITRALINYCFNGTQLIPKPSCRNAIGDGVCIITYGVHTSLAAQKKPQELVTNARR